MSSTKLHVTQPKNHKQHHQTPSLPTRYALLIAACCIYVFTKYFDVQVSIKPRSKLNFDDNVQVSIKRRSNLNFDDNEPRIERCKPDLPAEISIVDPISPTNQGFEFAAQALHRTFQDKVATEDIDSLVVGIVGPDGLLWWNGYGLEKANDTNSAQPPGIHSIYRVGSVSKLFATLETYILRDRGLLSWDDPVTKYFPNLTYRQHGWKEYLASNTTNHSNQTRLDPITLRQLGTHMSGIGRDYPSRNIDDWPNVPPPPISNVPPKSALLQAIAENPLVAAPYTYPIYSNTGFGMLGWCNCAADEMDTGKSITYAELAKRDIFEPLGMNGSSFLLTSENAERMVIPQVPDEASFDLMDTWNSAGGQMSSLSDLSKALRSFLNPERSPSVLSPYTLREWIRPLHVFPDGFSQTGLAWEIKQFPDDHGRIQNYYSKDGNLGHYNSKFTMNPQLGYGIIALISGSYSNSDWFITRTIDHFQNVFLLHLEAKTRERYSGTWKGKAKDGEGEQNSEIQIEVTQGVLWITKWIAEGHDYMKAFEEDWQDRVALWSTGRLDEFRVAVGHPGLNGTPTMGCFPYWVTMDPFNSHGAPVDLIYFEEIDGQLVLQFPSARVSLYRA